MQYENQTARDKRVAINKAVIQKLEASHGISLEALYRKDVRAIASDLRVFGYRCVQCGALVTVEIIRYFKFGPEAECYGCQKA